MRKLLSLIFIVQLITILNCSEEPSNLNENNLIGHWDSYEFGTTESGFIQNITNSLTIAYESGFSFHQDGTFSVRYFRPDNGEWSPPTIDDPGIWSVNDPIGIYQLKTDTISLIYFPGTEDELKLDLRLIKLDGHHLWFKHSYFGDTIEHHLVRHN